MEQLINVALNNSDLAEELYERYLIDRENVTEEWAKLFDQLNGEKAAPPKGEIIISSEEAAGLKIASLIRAYRELGYLAVQVNPLEEKREVDFEPLKIGNFGFKETDLKSSFPTLGLLPNKMASLEEIIKKLKQIYTDRIGFELPHSLPEEVRKWLLEKIESEKFDFSLQKRQHILEELVKAELLEGFLHTKFTGQKRFSLEGAETLIPMMTAMIEVGAEEGVSEVNLGMAHRGRLNVLANILKKPYVDIFSEFEEGYFPDSFEGTGDVKYHKGFLSEIQTVHGKKIKISLTPNASHLESVGAIIEGQVRGRQMMLKDLTRTKVIPILVHGDASVAGQGVVYETLQMYKLPGYTTGGTLHVVVNNQIGFTTLPEEGRSTKFCTDIAKTFGFPVFHLNAEEPEACVRASEIAMELRQKFHLDVFLELNCYRKWGHNESDEPAYTQPHLYKVIRAKKSIREIYSNNLEKLGVVEKFMSEKMGEEFKKALNDAKLTISEKPHPKQNVKAKQKSDPFKKITTAVTVKNLREVSEKIFFAPDSVKLHPKLGQLLKERLAMVIQEKNLLDWGMAEVLAYGTLLQEGISVRLAGQDSARGTFSHRHALFYDQEKGKPFNPFESVAKGAFIEVINSFLSEYAALGFEYGFSLTVDKALVIWEAQFGDFGNGGQIVLDQYISAAEQKWGQRSDLTLLLPHGYEGQGPEHSSARIERYLTLAASDNLFICNPTTPAQLFHLLRRQAKESFQRPLICFTPKSLLRHPSCQSPLKDLETGTFEEVLDDPENPDSGKRLYFCSGKIYYDLIDLRKKESIKDVIFIRIEQLYPLDTKTLQQIMKRYSKVESYYYVQEEPRNMGAFGHLAPRLDEILPKGKRVEYVGRCESASPATGSHELHKQELAAIFAAIKTVKKDQKIDVGPFQAA